MLTQIQEVEISIETARDAVSLGEAAKRLSSNPDFKKLIIDNYMEAEAARMARALADSTLDEDTRRALKRSIVGPGLLKLYLRQVVQQGEIAQRSIQEDMETLDELRAEEAAGE